MIYCIKLSFGGWQVFRIMKNSRFTKQIILIIKICLLGLLIGALGGLVGAAFSYLLSSVTGLREAVPWIILLLPLGGIITVAIYRIANMSDYGGANEIVGCIEKNKPIRAIAAPLIFVATAITHLFGGSAGKEGAALQLGGAGASAIANALRLKDDERTICVKSGMSAVFAGVFGTPLTAAVFILEFKSSRKKFFLSILPSFISATVAKCVASFLGVEGETVVIHQVADFTILSVIKILILSVGLALLARVMCFAFHGAQFWAKRLISNPFLRAILGSAIIIAMTALVGDMRYNGSGINIVMGAAEGKADYFDFILKIIFTSVTLAAGFKGGEIVPTFSIGASFGCVFGSILGLSGGFSASLGLIGLFAYATSSPLSALLLGIEMFGFSGLPYFSIVCLILWPLSAGKGLFDNRFFTSPIKWKKNLKDKEQQRQKESIQV